MKGADVNKIKYTPEDLVDHHGISAVIKDDHGNILMQEHVKYGFWTIPVGKVKHGQEVIEGLKEEVFEETNLNVQDCKELVFETYEYLRNEINVKVFTHIFEILKYSGDLKNKEPKKHLQQKFMSLMEVVKLHYLSDITLRYLETLGIKREPHI